MNQNLLKQLIKEEFISILGEDEQQQQQQEPKKKKNISYTGLVLFQESHNLLISRFKESDWESIAHHATINLGPYKGSEKLLGQEFDIVVDSFMKDDVISAVSVKLPTEINGKENPHITIAVNREGGGKPQMSNNLNWSQAESVEPMILKTKLLEVKQGENRFADDY